MVTSEKLTFVSRNKASWSLALHNTPYFPLLFSSECILLLSSFAPARAYFINKLCSIWFESFRLRHTLASFFFLRWSQVHTGLWDIAHAVEQFSPVSLLVLLFLLSSVYNRLCTTSTANKSQIYQIYLSRSSVWVKYEIWYRLILAKL
jgi:hypothetical protein